MYIKYIIKVAIKAVGTIENEVCMNRVIAVDKSSQKEIKGAAFVSADFTELQFRRYLTRILRHETSTGKANVGKNCCLFNFLASLLLLLSSYYYYHIILLMYIVLCWFVL